MSPELAFLFTHFAFFQLARRKERELADMQANELADMQARLRKLELADMQARLRKLEDDYDDTLHGVGDADDLPINAFVMANFYDENQWYPGTIAGYSDRGGCQTTCRPRHR